MLCLEKIIEGEFKTISSDFLLQDFNLFRIKSYTEINDKNIGDDDNNGDAPFHSHWWNPEGVLNISFSAIDSLKFLSGDEIKYGFLFSS